MKTTRVLITTIMFICCIGTFALAAKKSSADNVNSVTEKVQTLETNTEKQFLYLQEENKALKNQLQKMESEIALYRDDARTETSRMNTNMALWFSALTLVIGVITAALGVVAPIFFNREQNKQYKTKLEELQRNVNETKAGAESANRSLEDVEKLKIEITSIKNKIDESEKSAKVAADNAEINRLFTEALAEHDKDRWKAIELYTKILKIDKNYVKAYNNRAGLKKKIGDKDGALEDYNKAIDLNPNYASAYNNRANLKFQMNKTKEALKDINKANKLSPKNAYILNNRADLLLKLNRFNEALQDIKAAIEINNTFPYSYITKGEIYIAMNKHSEAIHEFTHALSLDNNIKDAYKYRAECYRELAKTAEDKAKKEEYIAYAGADEKKYDELNK